MPPVPAALGAAGVTPVAYRLPEGRQLTGYLSVPPTYRPGEKYPAILLIHGGKGVDAAGLQRQALTFLKTRVVQEHLAPRYVVFSAEYYSEYFADPRELASMAAALKTLTALPQVDPRKVAALGVSHGGYLALMCAVHPEIRPKPRAAVSVSGVVDVAAFVADKLRAKQIILSRWPESAGVVEREPYDYVTRKVVEAWGWPPDRDAATRENYRRASVLTYVKHLAGPLLVIHGSTDHLVPLSQAQELRKALKAQHKSGDVLIIPTGKTGGHFIFFTDPQVWQKIMAFLGQHL
ncbi:MAG: alpha/beta fold hydrolase [Thermodesulfobacteriota bacterium]